MAEAIEVQQLPPRDGFDLRREIHPDPQPAPEGDTYDDADRQAFADGKWGYVGLVVVASRSEIDLGHDGIWGVEHGDRPGLDWIDAMGDEPGSSWSEYGEELIASAISNARTTVKSIGLGT